MTGRQNPANVPNMRKRGKPTACRHCGDKFEGGKVVKAHEEWCDPANGAPWAAGLRAKRDAMKAEFGLTET